VGTVGKTLLGFHVCERCGISLANVQHIDEIQSSGTRLQRNGLILNFGQNTLVSLRIQRSLQRLEGFLGKQKRCQTTDNFN
jgi:hypothetical protein